VIEFGSESRAVNKIMDLNKLRMDDGTRRGRMRVRHQLLVGDYREIVRSRLRDMFARPEDADRVGTLADSSCNVFKFVNDEVAQFRGARRAFMNGSTRDEVYARLEENEEPFDLVMQKVVETLDGCNDGLIRALPGIPGAEGKAGRPSLRVFRPHECTVIPRVDDPTQPEVVMYDQLLRDGELVTVVWTPTEHFLVEGGRQRRLVPGASSYANPLGWLPFVAFHADVAPDRFWDSETGTDRAEFAIDYLAARSALRHLLHMQSHKQVAVSGNLDKSWRPPDRTGPGYIWKVTGNARFDVLDMASDPRMIDETLQSMLIEHLASHGLNPGTIGKNPGQAPPSGLSLYLDRQKVIERRRRYVPAIVEAEYALAEIYRSAWNASHAPKDHIDPNAEFTCEVLEETVVQSPQEAAETRKAKLEVYERERKLGLRSVVEQLAEDRGISEEEARKLLPTLPVRPELFAYDQLNGVIVLDEIRAAKGLGPHPNSEWGRMTIPELRMKYPEAFGAGTGTGGAE